MSDRANQKPKIIKTPGPDHPITIERNAHRIVVVVTGRVVADTRAGLTLREASYPPVQYIPLKDVDTALLERTDHATRVTALTTASPWGESVRSTLSGPMRRLTARSPRSRTTSLSIPTVWTPLRNGRRAIRRSNNQDDDHAQSQR